MRLKFNNPFTRKQPPFRPSRLKYIGGKSEDYVLESHTGYIPPLNTEWAETLSGHINDVNNSKDSKSAEHKAMVSKLGKFRQKMKLETNVRHIFKQFLIYYYNQIDFNVYVGDTNPDEEEIIFYEPKKKKKKYKKELDSKNEKLDNKKPNRVQLLSSKIQGIAGNSKANIGIHNVVGGNGNGSNNNTAEPNEKQNENQKNTISYDFFDYDLDDFGGNDDEIFAKPDRSEYTNNGKSIPDDSPQSGQGGHALREQMTDFIARSEKDTNVQSNFNMAGQSNSDSYQQQQAYAPSMQNLYTRSSWNKGMGTPVPMNNMANLPKPPQPPPQNQGPQLLIPAPPPPHPFPYFPMPPPGFYQHDTNYNPGGPGRFVNNHHTHPNNKSQPTLVNFQQHSGPNMNSIQDTERHQQQTIPPGNQGNQNGNVGALPGNIPHGNYFPPQMNNGGGYHAGGYPAAAAAAAAAGFHPPPTHNESTNNNAQKKTS